MPRSRRSEELREQARTQSFEEGEKSLRPLKKDVEPQFDEDDDDSLHEQEPSPRLESFTLPEVMELDRDELAEWAQSCGFIIHKGRVLDPNRRRDELEGHPSFDTELGLEIILDFHALSGHGISVIYTTLTAPQLCYLAKQVPKTFPTTCALFGVMSGVATKVSESREHFCALGNVNNERRKDGCLQRGKDGMTKGMPPMQEAPFTPSFLKSCLPVPEGTTGVFECEQGGVIDICSSGFVTCMGIVLVSRQKNGRRRVGMTHLNMDCVERVMSSFTSFVLDVCGPESSGLEIYLCGGGGGALASLTMLQSLFEFFGLLRQTKELECTFAGQTLFDHSSSYMFRSTDEGVSVHRPRLGFLTKKLEAKEKLLKELDPYYGLCMFMTGKLCLSGTDLISICTSGRPHPLGALLDDEQTKNNTNDESKREEVD